MRIFFVSGYNYWGKFSPLEIYEPSEKKSQIAGGETAMLHVARGLALLGHDVTVFYDVERPGQYHGVDFLPTNLFVPLICQVDFDVLVSWDNTHVFSFADRAKIHVMAYQLNDPEIGVFDWAIDRYFHPSDWHAKRTKEINPDLKWDENKHKTRITNGIDYTRYTLAKTLHKPETQRVIYSSSPDRGLHHLLNMWPEISEQVPEAELHVYYDMEKWLAQEREFQKAGLETATGNRARMIDDFRKTPHKNVFFHGGLNQWELAEEQMRAKVLAYPCDPIRPTEGYSMTILEGITSGCQVITTDADALAELWEPQPNVTILPLPVKQNVWVKAIVEALKKDPLSSGLYNPAFSWAHICKKWETELLLCLKESGRNC